MPTDFKLPDVGEGVASTNHTHPKLSEAVMEAAEHALGHAIHTVNR